jgi:hypothetical protein
LSTDALTFLSALWGSKPDDMLVGLWRKKDKKSLYFPTLDTAASTIEIDSKHSDVYVFASGARKKTPSTRRWTNTTVHAMPGVWADIDVNGGPENKTGAAPDLDVAQELAESVCVPTLVVSSGYGLQAWWLFEPSVWIFENVSARDDAAKLVQGFQGVLRGNARKLGFSLDSTHDLARLMRAPGGLNHKDADHPVPVELLDDGGPRYSLGELLEHAAKHKVVAKESRAVSVADVDPQRTPLAKLMALQDALDDFKKAWDHKPRRPSERDWSQSHWDLAISNCMVAAGWTDQEITDGLALGRERFAPGHEKNLRVDYYESTIRKARNYTHGQRQEEERTEAVERLEEVARDPDAATPEQTLAFFHKVVGGPEIKEFVQYGVDADVVRFKIVLADGREVQLGDSASLLSQPKFAANYLPATAHVIPNMKPADWKNVVQGLMKAVTVVQDEEDSLASRAVAWVVDFTERRVSSDKDLACLNNDAFRDGDQVFISMGKLSQWLRRIRGERIVDADVRQALLAAGFKRTTVNYTKPDGKRSTRSYFRGPLALLEGE